MRRMTPVLCLWVVLLGFGWTDPARAGDDSVGADKGIWIDGEEIVFRPDGTADPRSGGGAGGKVGSDFEFVLGERRGSVRSGAHLAPSDWGTSLLAHTELKRGRDIVFHLEWREEGKLVRTEEVVSRDFDAVTRTFLVEPGTGLKHVVRFSPVMHAEGAPPPAPQRVERMKLDLGMTPSPFLRDGKMLALVPGFGPGFERIYVNLPGTGFFQFSLQPFPGADPSGRLEGSVLSFDWREDKYQWFLGRSPLPEGTWTVFVKATEQIPPERRDSIRPEFAGEIVVGGSSGPP